MKEKQKKVPEERQKRRKKGYRVRTFPADAHQSGIELLQKRSIVGVGVFSTLSSSSKSSYCSFVHLLLTFILYPGYSLNGDKLQVNVSRLRSISKPFIFSTKRKVEKSQSVCYTETLFCVSWLLDNFVEIGRRGLV